MMPMRVLVYILILIFITNKHLQQQVGYGSNIEIVLIERR